MPVGLELPRSSGVCSDPICWDSHADVLTGTFLCVFRTPALTKTPPSPGLGPPCVWQVCAGVPLVTQRQANHLRLLLTHTQPSAHSGTVMSVPMSSFRAAALHKACWDN